MLTKLERLVLAGLEVSPEALGAVAKLKNLKYLNLNKPGIYEEPRIDDEAIAVLARATNLRQLTLHGADLMAPI